MKGEYCMKIGRIGNNYGNIVTNGKIIINGKEYTGKNISIINNKVMIDGKEYQEEEKEIRGDVNTMSGNIIGK